MATLHLICGLPCAGKTTLARHLEQEYTALRLNLDEWHTRLFGQDAQDARHDARHAVIEALLWEMAARVLRLGVHVILDYGFWSHNEREEYRARAAGLGASSELHFVHAPEAVLFERLARRNADLPPGTFFIPAAKLKEYLPQFQPPSAAELERRE
jgi:predicted kinase